MFVVQFQALWTLGGAEEHRKEAILSDLVLVVLLLPFISLDFVSDFALFVSLVNPLGSIVKQSHDRFGWNWEIAILGDSDAPDILGYLYEIDVSGHSLTLANQVSGNPS